MRLNVVFFSLLATLVLCCTMCKPDDDQEENVISKTFNTENSALPGNFVSSVLQVDTGVVFAGTYKGMIKFFNNGIMDDYQANVVDLPGDSISCLTVSSNYLLIGTLGAGVKRGNYIEGTDAISMSTSLDEQYTGLLSDHVYSVMTASNDEDWMGTGKGISIHPVTSWVTEDWKSITMDNGLMDNKITSLAQSSTGEVWIGTPRGAHLYDKDSLLDFSTGSPLENNLINDILILPGQVGFATSSGLHFYDKTGKSWSSNETLKNIEVLSLFYDEANDQLLAGTRMGLKILENGNPVLAKELKIVANYEINDIAMDGNDIIWLATNQGLVYLRLK